MKKTRDLFACGLWVVAVTLMTFGTFAYSRSDHTTPLLAWGLFSGVMACVPTGWSIIEKLCDRQEQTSVEHIVEIVDALHQARRDVARLH